MDKLLRQSTLAWPGASRYKAALQAAINEQRARSRPAGTATTEWVPLEDQIHRWWAQLPPVIQARRFQITEITAALRGRYRPRPSPAHVASVLRDLGWREVRDWTSQGLGRRYWLPTRHNGKPVRP